MRARRLHAVRTLHRARRPFGGAAFGQVLSHRLGRLRLLGSRLEAHDRYLVPLLAARHDGRADRQDHDDQQRFYDQREQQADRRAAVSPRLPLGQEGGDTVGKLKQKTSESETSRALRNARGDRLRTLSEQGSPQLAGHG